MTLVVLAACGGTSRAQTQDTAHFSLAKGARALTVLAGVAVDGNGNVYIADTYNFRLLKETLQPGGAYKQSTMVKELIFYIIYAGGRR